MEENEFIIARDESILVTGANGFIGTQVVRILLEFGFKKVRCFVRPSGNVNRLKKMLEDHPGAQVEIVQGNLLSLEDCRKACNEIKVILHLAAGVEKSFAGCFLNSVVTTRNLLEEVRKNKDFRRFLNVSSIAVYSGLKKKRGALLDETSDEEQHSHIRYEGYTYGKVKQDEIIRDYNERYGIPYVIVRPGVVFGPGKKQVMGRVGLDTFGFFIHLGGSNLFPLTYVDNCAEAIVLAGLKRGIDGEVFNIIDDDPPTCRKFLSLYKKNVASFKSVYVPFPIFYSFCHLWEKYSQWSDGQLPPVFNKMRCAAHWQGRRFSNQKAKKMLGWEMRVPMEEGLKNYFEYVKAAS
jgi:nucleoside-diphosphate-sugar epimerase